MLTVRIIPCLDIRDGRIVKGVRFQELRDAGCPVERSRRYEEQGADEIVLLDVSATVEGRRAALETVRAVRAVLSIPLLVGGGVRVPEDVAALLDAGADKVSVNTAAVENPNLLSQMAKNFGTQCTVLAIDAKSVSPGRWRVVTRGGATETERDACEWAREAVSRGAGEILLTSWDRDGTRSGYDCALLGAVAAKVPVPVIASGGANTIEDMQEGLTAGASALLAASIFHDGDVTVSDIKAQLREAGVEVREQ